MGDGLSNGHAVRFQILSVGLKRGRVGDLQYFECMCGHVLHCQH